jgi:predicted transcriptional regulator
MPLQLHAFLRKWGFIETLQILHSFENHEISQNSFFKIMQSEWDSYPNRFFRVQKLLLDLDLIRYRLNEENAKMICLTEKGIHLFELLTEIGQLIDQ